MATATTAHHSPVSAPGGLLAGRGFEFHEIMAGDCTFTDGPIAGRSARVEFDLRAHAPDLAAFLRKSSGKGVFRTAKLEGSLRIEGIPGDLPASGAIEMNLVRSRGMMIYDLDFTGPDGKAYHLHGEKHRNWLNFQKGMTTLYTDITEKGSGKTVGSGILYFDLKTIVPFLRSWKLVRA